MPSLADLPAGHTFEPITFTVGADESRAYRDATGDRLGLYDEAGVVPPLAVAALALGALMEVIDLPDGTLHGNESLQVQGLAPVGATFTCAPSISRNTTRGGMVFITLDFAVSHNDAPVLTARSAVLFPAEPGTASAPGPQPGGAP